MFIFYFVATDNLQAESQTPFSINLQFHRPFSLYVDLKSLVNSTWLSWTQQQEQANIALMESRNKQCGMNPTNNSSTDGCVCLNNTDINSNDTNNASCVCINGTDVSLNDTESATCDCINDTVSHQNKTTSANCTCVNDSGGDDTGCVPANTTTTTYETFCACFNSTTNETTVRSGNTSINDTECACWSYNSSTTENVRCGTIFTSLLLNDTL